MTREQVGLYYADVIAPKLFWRTIPANLRGRVMPKALCLIGLVISILVFLLFTLDLMLGLSGMAASAPFRAASSMMDVVFILSSGGLIYLSWITFREQR